jgi:two-component system, NarL family, sensor kinase
MARVSPLSRPVLQFALSGLLALLLVGVGAFFVLRNEADSQSVQDARRLTRVIATSAIEPALTNGLVHGAPDAVARMDRLVGARVIRDPVVRVKLWTLDGRVVYSDEHRLIGARYPLSEDDREALTSGKVAAEVSDLERPENRFERRFDKLLEVYLPVHTPGGTPLLFESYMRYSAVSATAREIWLPFLLTLFVALGALWLVQIPLAVSLVRRLKTRQREREELLVQAIEASDVERRRIAADLHDGAVQDLAGIAYSLDVGATQAQTRPREELGSLLREGARVTRESMRQLRSLLVEIYPPNLHDTGLEAAIEDLLAPLRRRGIEAKLQTEDVGRLRPQAEQLIFRTAQEALRNVADHADASCVAVSLERLNGKVVAVVEDDGAGFDPAVAATRRREGHFGISLLVDRARDLGGALAIESAPGKGTAVRLEVPAE